MKIGAMINTIIQVAFQSSRRKISFTVLHMKQNSKNPFAKRVEIRAVWKPSLCTWQVKTFDCMFFFWCLIGANKGSRVGSASSILQWQIGGWRGLAHIPSISLEIPWIIKRHAIMQQTLAICSRHRNTTTHYYDKPSITRAAINGPPRAVKQQLFLHPIAPTNKARINSANRQITQFKKTRFSSGSQCNIKKN